MAQLQKRMSGLARQNKKLQGHYSRLEAMGKAMNVPLSQTVQQAFELFQHNMVVLAHDIDENKRPDVGVFATDFASRMDEIEAQGRDLFNEFSAALEHLDNLPTLKQSQPDIQIKPT